MKPEYVVCSLASVAIISKYMQSEMCLSSQHLCEAREAPLPIFLGREITSWRCKCVQALHLCWPEQGPTMQAVGWEGTGRDRMEPSPTGFLLHLSTTHHPFAGTVVLGAKHENENVLSCFHSFRDFNSLCWCSPSPAVHGRLRIRLGF